MPSTKRIPNVFLFRTNDINLAILFRGLCEAEMESYSQVALLKIVVSMRLKNEKVGYLLLHFMNATSSEVGPYRLMAENMKIEVERLLVADLKQCALDD